MFHLAFSFNSTVYIRFFFIVQDDRKQFIQMNHNMLFNNVTLDKFYFNLWKFIL